MNDEKSVPYIVFEGTVARHERTIRRLIITIVIAILAIFASNAFWLYEWSQYDYMSYSEDVEVKSEDGGNANYLGYKGNIYNGIRESQETSDIPEEEETFKRSQD